MSVAGGSDRPPAAEFRELSLAPWDYMRQVMEFSRAVAGVAAVAAVVHTVWPFRGPMALGGEKKGTRTECERDERFFRVFSTFVLRFLTGIGVLLGAKLCPSKV